MDDANITKKGNVRSGLIFGIIMQYTRSEEMQTLEKLVLDL